MEEIAEPTQEAPETPAAMPKKPGKFRWLALPLVAVGLVVMLFITHPW
jgi:hypothetical protein